jgi:hypothetical protein
MALSIYTRDEQGIVSFEGQQGWSSEFQFLEHFDLLDVEPQEERVKGWPHSRVRWFVRDGAPTIAAIGIGG